MSNITIREASENHIDEIIRLCRQLGYDLPGEKITRQFKTLAVSENDIILVALKGEKAIGWIHAVIYSVLYHEQSAQILRLVASESLEPNLLPARYKAAS